ncbi:Speckle-type POZ protein [Hordeum vulgare]|nr:Speckle-type POZ protein [Hordeum vulgare]
MSLNFTKHFPSMSMEFKLKMNTGCSWRVTVRLLNGRVTFDQGWATFVVNHKIKIGFMLAFKLLTPDMLKVFVFNNDGIEVVTRCGKQEDAFVINS